MRSLAIVRNVCNENYFSNRVFEAPKQQSKALIYTMSEGDI